MVSVIVVFVLLVASIAGVYLLLKSMGQDGIEAAAPGSCKSGKCGVQPGNAGEPNTGMVPEQYVRIDEIKR